MLNDRYYITNIISYYKELIGLQNVAKKYILKNY